MAEVQREKLEVVGQNLLPAIAYGDAAGLPFENQPPQKPGSINGLKDVTENPLVGRYPAGTWSDDTHLSLATALSLINFNGFSLAAQAESHIIAYEHVNGSKSREDYIPPIVTEGKLQGWGPSTTESISKLKAGVSPLKSGKEGSTGNGVLMKMAPLVFWHAARDTSHMEVNAECIKFTKMTHDTREAMICSLVHAQMLRWLINEDSDNFDPVDFYSKAYTAAHFYDARYYTKSIDDEPSHKTEDNPRATSGALWRIYEFIISGTLEPEDIVEKAQSNGFTASETLMMAYGSFVLEQTFPGSVYRAVELGGDADSIGSIVSTMSLFLSGGFKKPADYEKLFAIERLERISEQLAEIALNSKL